MKKTAFPLILAPLLLAAPLAAHAQITCAASNITLNFGSYDVLSSTPANGAGSFQVTCTSVGLLVPQTTVTYRVALASSPARRLAPPAGADRLIYEVYTDASRTQPWGDGTGGTSVIQGSVTVPLSFLFIPGTVTDAPRNFYARITPGGQDVSAASPGPPPTIYQQTLPVTTTCTPRC